ncbi:MULTISPECIES: DUF4190 domain-containing protein [Curtobacterium]|uniref:DUF4190 domain-containing protein n=1 Tax=Curtobacterium citri TaxID=3055139 RepID=A0ABT7T6K8_9MICO|nr:MULTISPECIES: DUF4190 domain-containing protein [Curtobacterium]MDM7885219.1 DUF4190 domain-containing protein [Curtobacterium citri]
MSTNGYPPAPNTPGAAPATNGGNGLAIGSLVLGIVGTVAALFIPIVGLIGGIVGLVLGFLARRRGQARGMVLGGIILSIVAIVLAVIGFILAAVVFSQLMQNQ